jgi:hypothetical protein
MKLQWWQMHTILIASNKTQHKTFIKVCKKPSWMIILWKIITSLLGKPNFQTIYNLSE